MNERDTRPIRPGGQLSAGEFNRAMKRLDDLQDFSGGGIGSSDEFGQVVLHSLTAPRTLIKIASGSNPYAWDEVYLEADNATWTVTGARSGTTTETPAIERNGDATVAADAVYEATFDPGPDGAGRWLFTSGAAVAEDFFPARLDCRNFVSSKWEYAWTEMEWLTKAAAATVKSGGRVGYLAAFATVAITQLGDAGTPEIETVVICSQPLTSGTWSLSAATGLAYNISAASLTTALTSALGVTVTATGSMTGGWTLTWAANGVRTTLVANVSGLVPSGSLYPALELNNQPVKIGLIVWMRRGLPATGEDYRFAKPKTECGYEDTAGYVAADTQFLSHDAGGCLLWVSTSEEECPPP